MTIDDNILNVRSGKYLPERELKLLCEKVKELLVEESNIQPVFTPISVCGDIHGQFYDLLELFNRGGEIPDTSYIFIGDFVDRGYHSVESLQLLMCLKVKYPGKITLLRGNHESRTLTQTYGFYDEILRKYGNIHPWKYCTEVFDLLPLGAIIDGKILCIHGGLSPQLKTIDQFRSIERRQEIPQDGSLADIMWSDPDDDQPYFRYSPRGAGWLFGENVMKNFNFINGLDMLCRAHQLVQEGYKYSFQESLLTIWSAPNYCYRCGNLAAIFSIDESHSKKFTIFDCVPKSTSSIPAPSNVLPYFL